MRRTLTLANLRSGKMSPVEQVGDPTALSLDFISYSVERFNRTVGPPRASSLYSTCMRKHCLSRNVPADTTESIGIQQKLTFALGEKVHEGFQNDSFPLGDTRRGKWECQACKRVTHFSPPPTKNCVCGAYPSAYKYKECVLYLMDKRTNYPQPDRFTVVSGHPDMFVERDKNIRVLELKTINGKDYDALQGPLIEHQWQVQAYMLCLESGMFDFGVDVDTSLAYVMYITKQFSPKNFPFKTYIVKNNTFLRKHVEDRLKQYSDYVKGVGNLPERIQACRRSTYHRCPVNTLCESEV